MKKNTLFSFVIVLLSLLSFAIGANNAGASCKGDKYGRYDSDNWASGNDYEPARIYVDNDRSNADYERIYIDDDGNDTGYEPARIYVDNYRRNENYNYGYRDDNHDNNHGSGYGSPQPERVHADDGRGRNRHSYHQPPPSAGSHGNHRY